MITQHIFIQTKVVNEMMKELKFEKTVLACTALMALFLVAAQTLS